MDPYALQNPFAGMKQNERDWFVPELYQFWRTQSIFNQLVPNKVQVTNTNTMYFDMVDWYEPLIDPIGFYDTHVAPMQFSSKRVKIETLRYGGKVQYYEQDDFIKYWRLGQLDRMSQIVTQRLGPAITNVLERLARNAFFQTNTMYTLDPAKTSFADITSTDLFGLDWPMHFQFIFQQMGAPGFSTFRPKQFICVVHPHVALQIRQNSDWEKINLNTESGRNALLGNVIGSIGNVTFIEDSLCALPNAGAVTAQTKIMLPVKSGDGAKYEQRGYYVGSPTATEYITVEDSTGFAVGDIIQVHRSRTSLYGVTNGVDPYDGYSFTREIAHINGNQIYLNKPLNWPFEDDLGGHYGWVTKARHLAVSLFLGAPGGVVMGVTNPIEIHRPAPDDEFNRVIRVTWDGFFKYQPFWHDLVRPVVHAVELGNSFAQKVDGT